MPNFLLAWYKTEPFLPPLTDFPVDFFEPLVDALEEPPEELCAELLPPDEPPPEELELLVLLDFVLAVPALAFVAPDLP